MKSLFWPAGKSVTALFVAGTLTALGLAAAAADGSLSAGPGASPAQAPNPDNPAAVVPALSYRSSIRAPATLETPGSTPWRQANAEVAQFPRGHMDILKWEAANPEPPPSAISDGSNPATGGRP